MTTHNYVGVTFHVQCNSPGCGVEYDQTIQEMYVGRHMSIPIECCGVCGSRSITVMRKKMTNPKDIKEGVRIRLKHDVDRYPHFTAKAGMTGTIVRSVEGVISARMDKHIDGAEEWDNCIEWVDGSDPDATRELCASDVEIIA